MAAGFGTRLGSLTELRPKPMLPLCGSPLIEWAVLYLRHQGVRELVINLHHMGEQIEAYLGDGSRYGLAIVYSREATILGTGGGLREARSLLDDGKGTPIVVMNGKILMELQLAAVLDHHRRTGAEATWVMRDDLEGVWGGSLAARSDGRMVNFLGERLATAAGTNSEDRRLMFTGVHVFAPEFLDRIPTQGEQCIARTAYRTLFHEGGRFQTFVTPGYWWEHSTPDRYLAGIRNVLDGKVSLPHAKYRLRGVHPSARIDAKAALIDPVWVGPNVRILAGATVGPHVQLDSGVRVASGLHLHNCAVWSNVDVRRNLGDEIVAI